MNTQVVSLHNSTPFSLFFARKANGFSNYTNDNGQVLTTDEMLERLKYMTEIVFPAIEEKSRATQKKMISRFNAAVLQSEFPEGAKVMTLDPIKGDKLSPRYEGPYTVEQRTSHGSYVLRDGTGAPLKRHFAPSQLKLVLEDIPDAPTFTVKKLLGHRDSSKVPGTKDYEVQWKDYDLITWEHEGHFVEWQCIRDYWDEQAKKEGTTLPTSLTQSSTPDTVPTLLPNTLTKRVSKRPWL